MGANAILPFKTIKHMNIKDFILETTPPEAYEALKNEEFYSLLLKMCKFNYPKLYELIEAAYDLRFQGVTTGVELRYRNEDKVNFLDKNIKSSLKIINAECFRVGLIPILFKSMDDILDSLDTQINLIKSFPTSLEASLKELERIFIKSFDKIVTPQYRLAAGLSEDNSEDFKFLSEILQNELNENSLLENDGMKSKIMLFSSNMIKLYTLVIFELAYYQKTSNLRISIDEASAIPNDGSRLTVMERKNIVTLELAFMSGSNKFGNSIIMDNDFKRMIEYTFQLVASTEPPTIERKIPNTNMTMERIRYAYSKIHKRIYGVKGEKDRFVDFLHATFEQFTCEKSTTKTKFSVVPKDLI